MDQKNNVWNTSFKPLFIGFGLSLVLVLFVYGVVVDDFLETSLEFPAIIFLGALQAVLQLIYFFHVGLESNSKWNLLMLLFMIFVVFIIVGGSIWIMYNLNYDLMI